MTAFLDGYKSVTGDAHLGPVALAFEGKLRERMGPTLRIIAINDVYSLENLPRLKKLVAHHKATRAADRTLVTVAGDFVAPSVLSGLDSGRGMVDCFNDIGVTHLVFGNHEDDIPTEELHARVAEIRATCLATNLPDFDEKMRRSDVIEVGGGTKRRVQVGLVGVVMTDPTIYRRPAFGGTRVLPANESALTETSRLLQEQCTTVIPLTHQTLAEDRELALSKRQPPYPVIVAGHEHEVLLEQLEGTWIVKAGSDAVHAAVIDLEWPEHAPSTGDADVPSVSVRIDDVSHYAEDAELRAKVDGHMAKVRDLENATLVLLAPGDVLSSIGTRVRQTSLGTLLASRIRDALGAHVCVINGGGVRGSREYRGHLTYGDLKAEVPFDNELVVVPLPGRVLFEAVRGSRVNAPNESGGFLQVDDGVTVNANNLITHVGVEPFDLNRTYRVALVRNLLTGLDRIDALARFGRELPDRVPPEGCGREVKLVLVEAFAKELWQHLGSFASIDADQDGSVSQPELAAAVARINKKPPSNVTSGLILQALDTNNDGVISSEEAEHARLPRKPTT